ncbi:MAG: hypothetical protein AB8G17_19825 [Gammaproteobacteria bacterium]
MKQGLRQLIGAAVLIIAIGLPSCVAFKNSVASAPTATQSAD